MTERSVYWANHLKAIDAEGISARAYAAREGLAIQSLYQWRQKLSQSSDLKNPHMHYESMGYVKMQGIESLGKGVF